MATDNSNRAAKKHLRKVATQNLGTLRVLDCYAGDGAMWTNVKKEKYLGIEKQKHKGNSTNGIIHGDNLKLIPKLDLSSFNVIDLDAYGVPFDQMKAVLDSETLKEGTVIVYTAIKNAMSGMNKNAQKMLNVEEMYKKSPHLIKPLYIDAFYQLLKNYGIEKINELDQQNLNTGNYEKHYGFFTYKNTT